MEIYKYNTPNGGYNEVTSLDKIPNGFSYETIEINIDEQLNLSNTQLYTELLKERIVELRIKAKGLAIGKIGTNAYILAQVDFYEIKYENASNPNPINEIDDDLAAEGMRDFGMSLSDFKDLIITMYQAGKQKETLLMSFIEQGRSAILTLMANANWTAVDQAFLLTEELRGITTIEQARIIKNQILEL